MIRIEDCKFTIAFEELDQSPTEIMSKRRGVTSAKRIVQCVWTDRIQLAKEFIGYIEQFGSDFITHRPHVYDEVSSLLIAVSVDMIPFARLSTPTTEGFNTYDTAQLTVSYEVRQSEEAPEEEEEKEAPEYGGTVLISESMEPSSEFITLPTKNLFWGKGDDKEAIDTLDAPAKVNSMIEWVYNIRNATIIPINVWSIVGKINKEACSRSAYYAPYPKGTLLCGNPTIRRELTAEGYKYDITYRFLYKLTGWNHFPRVSKSGGEISYERITDGTNDKNIYEEVSFAGLLP